MHKYYFFLVSFILLQGCSSIEQPIASRPLVEQEYIVTTPVENDDMQSILNNTPSDSTITLKDEVATLGPVFFAASGVHCRKAIVIPGEQQLFCQNQFKQWYQVQSVMSEYNDKLNGGIE
jgi:hypothetical protein